MDLLVDIFLILLAILLTFAFWFIKQNRVTNRSAILKKEELISNYKDDMKKIIVRYSSNDKELKAKKLEFIKRVNGELSTNIFFNKDDIKRVVYELSNM